METRRQRTTRGESARGSGGVTAATEINLVKRAKSPAKVRIKKKFIHPFNIISYLKFQRILSSLVANTYVTQRRGKNHHDGVKTATLSGDTAKAERGSRDGCSGYEPRATCSLPAVVRRCTERKAGKLTMLDVFLCFLVGMMMAITEI
ncbi:hypothetical protein EVAR_81453_1 [Eumeta japonica]|uniref:Uncharacterized protein n=1 Tax=Eumeta variegata TaxID=151549 RepID=A0A4C1W0Q2_EUMVA|nr:hypothetical protein EVAR_81453_1 [Eumeta japonica]